MPNLMRLHILNCLRCHDLGFVLDRFDHSKRTPCDCEAAQMKTYKPCNCLKCYDQGFFVDRGKRTPCTCQAARPQHTPPPVIHDWGWDFDDDEINETRRRLKIIFQKYSNWKAGENEDAEELAAGQVGPMGMSQTSHVKNG